MVVTTIIFYSEGVEIIQESKALHRLCGQRGADDSKRANKCPLIFSLIHFIDLQCRQGEWNAAQLSHVTVAKELYSNFKFSKNNLMFTCVSELLKIS